MIEWWQALILALIQGITEFLPISSSAHLILPSQILGWDDQGLAFDVAVHFGSLVAVIAYFRQRVSLVVTGGFRSLKGDWTVDGKLAWMLALATIPAGLAGLAFDDYIEASMRTSLVIAMTTLAGAVLLFLSDSARSKSREKSLVDITWKLALIIGLAQALALIPGTSRSGITITMALFLGFQRSSAAEFSFLLSIPVILLSAGWKSIDLLGLQDIDWGQVILAVLVSGISAYLCIKYFLAFIERIGFLPFVIYRLLLGAVLLLLFV